MLRSASSTASSGSAAACLFHRLDSRDDLWRRPRHHRRAEGQQRRAGPAPPQARRTRRVRRREPWPRSPAPSPRPNSQCSWPTSPGGCSRPLSDDSLRHVVRLRLEGVHQRGDCRGPRLRAADGRAKARLSSGSGGWPRGTHERPSHRVGQRAGEKGRRRFQSARRRRSTQPADRFEAAWRSGGQPRFEDHLPVSDGPFRAALKAELIAIELEWRRRREGLQPRADPRLGQTTTLGPPGRGILETLSASVGPVPHVLLRDTDGGPEPPLCRPGEASRGRARDTASTARSPAAAWAPSSRAATPTSAATWPSRSCCDDHRDNPDLVRRFVEEAQIGGQLQHPGIVPVYELGTFADRRPFFAMKLVKGRHAGRAARRPRRTRPTTCPGFLSIFEAICQTMAYAHARGVIHRDLKPSNVMVGSLRRGPGDGLGPGQGPGPRRRRRRCAGRQADRRGDASSPRPGAARTPTSRRPARCWARPATWPPSRPGARSSGSTSGPTSSRLGSILCEILTGQPAFIGPILERDPPQGGAGRHWPTPVARLDACGADAELIALARDCLALEPEDRPRTPAPWPSGSRPTWRACRTGCDGPNWARVEAASPASADDGGRARV